MLRSMSTELLPPEVAVELLEASAEATIVANADGEIIFVNREAEPLEPAVALTGKVNTNRVPVLVQLS